MIEENRVEERSLTEFEMHVNPSPKKDKRKPIFIVVVLLFIIGIFFIGIITAANNYFNIGGEKAGLIQPEVPLYNTGLKGLDNWNIEAKELEYDELRARYNTLYNYTYPFLVKEAITSEIIPQGVPAVYGGELSVAFDADTDRMTSVLRKYEDHPLNDEQMERYKDIGLRISCEYCCGVEAIIFENGERACGCAHSYAMRGLAKYLIINHPDDYSNDEILLELGKWKATFFPKQTISKAVLKYAELGNIDPSILTEMPNMVGRC
jgi:hypothetical protein